MEIEKKEYNKFKSILNNHELYLDDYELEELMAAAVQQDGWVSNKGYKFKRTEYNPSELAFYEQWLEENKPLPYINNGHGILQDLFIEQTNSGFGRKWVETINNRDRFIVATVIQWLGSNVGMGFLHAALRRFNARIVEDTMPKEQEADKQINPL